MPLTATLVEAPRVFYEDGVAVRLELNFTITHPVHGQQTFQVNVSDPGDVDQYLTAPSDGARRGRLRAIMMPRVRDVVTRLDSAPVVTVGRPHPDSGTDVSV